MTAADAGTFRARMSRAESTLRRTMASQADRHALYEQAVQDPERDVRFFSKVYRRLRGHDAVRLREDFCGTAALCHAWAQSMPERTAVGVDLCEETMEWGRRRWIEPAGEEVASRIALVHGDVREARGPKADLACGLNFSYNIFKTRAELREYFEAARAGLDKDGLFFIDLLGGMESMIEGVTDNDQGDFIYRWEQARFNARTHELLCYIHFVFPDGSEMRRAYTYDWRLWTAPELRELLLEAGFSKVHFYWEKTDREGEGTGVFYEPSFVENQEIWWTYMAAEA